MLDWFAPIHKGGSVSSIFSHLSPAQGHAICGEALNFPRNDRHNFSQKTLREEVTTPGSRVFQIISPCPRSCITLHKALVS
jgi:hypothetical protein